MQDWLERIHGTLAQHLVQVLKLNAVHNRSALPPFRFAAIAQQFLATLKEFAGSRDGDAVRAVGRSLAEQGLGLRTVLALGRSLLDDALGAPAPESTTAQEPASRERILGLNDFMTAILEGITEGETQTITRQRDDIQGALERMIAEREKALRRMIQELSTPIMPVFDRILVLPLIGEIDDERAQRIAERVLEEIVLKKARVILIDVTGIVTLSEQAAMALLRTANAVRLLGARPILVGLSPMSARLLAQHELDLAGLVVEADLQHGIEQALQLSGAPRPRPRSSTPAGSKA
jgi:rsbT co-antagonist protein RsbR